jgi:hypothetical protein
MPVQLANGSVEGLAYLLPNPELQGYTLIYGAFAWATAMSVPEGEKATPKQTPVGTVDGLAYLVPKPALQGYTLI